MGARRIASLALLATSIGCTKQQTAPPQAYLDVPVGLVVVGPEIEVECAETFEPPSMLLLACNPRVLEPKLFGGLLPAWALSAIVSVRMMKHPHDAIPTVWPEPAEDTYEVEAPFRLDVRTREACRLDGTAPPADSTEPVRLRCSLAFNFAEAAKHLATPISAAHRIEVRVDVPIAMGRARRFVLARFSATESRVADGYNAALAGPRLKKWCSQGSALACDLLLARLPAPTASAPSYSPSTYSKPVAQPETLQSVLDGLDKGCAAGAYKACHDAAVLRVQHNEQASIAERDFTTACDHGYVQSCLHLTKLVANDPSKLKHALHGACVLNDGESCGRIGEHELACKLEWTPSCDLRCAAGVLIACEGASAEVRATHFAALSEKALPGLFTTCETNKKTSAGWDAMTSDAQKKHAASCARTLRELELAIEGASGIVQPRYGKLIAEMHQRCGTCPG